MSDGIVLWRGLSVLDQKTPIAVVATGLDATSRNAKTGEMVQITILLEDAHPQEGIDSGLDYAICGSCRHRGVGYGIDRTCYVNVAFSVAAIWRAYKAGSYPNGGNAELRACGLPIRVGAYGDPAAVPLAVWLEALDGIEDRTGYTHQWSTCDEGFRGIVMASVDTPEEALEARALGYRYFRDGLPDEPPTEGEITCPASKEAGHKTDCASCRLCDGVVYEDDPKKNIVILAHGAGAARFARLRRNPKLPLAPVELRQPTRALDRVSGIRPALATEPTESTQLRLPVIDNQP